MCVKLMRMCVCVYMTVKDFKQRVKRRYAGGAFPDRHCFVLRTARLRDIVRLMVINKVTRCVSHKNRMFISMMCFF
jgi:hypothetical protein